jgi:hypothetical protein
LDVVAFAGRGGPLADKGIYFVVRNLGGLPGDRVPLPVPFFPDAAAAGEVLGKGGPEQGEGYGRVVGGLDLKDKPRYLGFELLDCFVCHFPELKNRWARAVSKCTECQPAYDGLGACLDGLLFLLCLAILSFGFFRELCKELVQEIPLCPDYSEGGLDDFCVGPGSCEHLPWRVQGGPELFLDILLPAMWHDFGKWDFEVADESAV